MRRTSPRRWRFSSRICLTVYTVIPQAEPQTSPLFLPLVGVGYCYASSTTKGANKKPRRLAWFFVGSPCWARTSDTLINSQVLVPTELRRNGFRGSPLLGRSSDVKRRKNTRETLFSFPCCVGYELSSRAVSSQVLLPLQRLTSVFGMGTGGPTALK